MLKIALLSLLTTANAFEIASQETGDFFDVPLTMIREEDRHDHVQSVFEQRRVWREDGEHPILSEPGKYVDAYMEMMWDYNHVMAVRLHNATDDMHLIPTTMVSEMVLMHNNCTGCWSKHGSKW